MEFKILDTFVSNANVNGNIGVLEPNTNIINNNNKDKELFLRNEISRLVKENTSLRLEMNYIYDQLREENKMYEIREDRIPHKSNKIIKESRSEITKEFKDSTGTLQSSIMSNNNLNQPASDGKYVKKKSIGYASGEGSTNINTNMNRERERSSSNPVIVFNVGKKPLDEKYFIAKNYIKMIKQSEFYMI